MSEFPNRATLEAAIVRVAFYYCQMRELSEKIYSGVFEIAQANQALSTRDHLYEELSRLTQLLSNTPPDAPRSMPSTIRRDPSNT